MKKFKKIRTKRIYRFGHYYRVEVDEVLTPGGHKGEYSVVRQAPYILIIPVDAEGNIYLVGQHRYPIDQVALELPAGNPDGQPFLRAAKRELLEETGLEADEWTKIGIIFESEGIGEIKGVIFIAQGVRTVAEPHDMDNEHISEVIKCSVSEIVAKIKSGEITDAATISAFSKAYFLGLLG